MTKRKQNERDPELETLLGAYRSAVATEDEKESWNRAIRQENAAFEAARISAPVALPITGFRRTLRTALQVAVAASLGLVVGAYWMETRYNGGEALLFSQSEPDASESYTSPSEEAREVVRVEIR